MDNSLQETTSWYITTNSMLHRTPTAAQFLPELYSSHAVGAGERQAVRRLMTISREALQGKIDADLALAHPDGKYGNWAFRPSLGGQRAFAGSLDE